MQPNNSNLGKSGLGKSGAGVAAGNIATERLKIGGSVDLGHRRLSIPVAMPPGFPPRSTPSHRHCFRSPSTARLSAADWRPPSNAINSCPV